MHNRLKNWMKLEDLKSSNLADNIGVNRATIFYSLVEINQVLIFYKSY